MDSAGAGGGSGFEPKEEFVTLLISLGFSRNAAIKVCLIVQFKSTHF